MTNAKDASADLLPDTPKATQRRAAGKALRGLRVVGPEGLNLRPFGPEPVSFSIPGLRNQDYGTKT